MEGDSIQMDRLNILVLQPDFSRYTSAYYQHDFTEALGRRHQVFRYGPDRYNPTEVGYDRRHSIEDVLRLCPFDPDLICFAAGWEVEDPTVPEYDPHPAIQVSDIGIPSVMVLNKEYKKLDKKFEFIRHNGIRLVFTVHHHYDRWQQEVGVPFIHFPFAVDPELFRDYGLAKRYSIGFSGQLQQHSSDVRARIKQKLFWKRPIKFPRYWGMRVFWSEGRMPLVNRSIESYARLINRSKVWISTPSPADLVGTRYYEIMAARTLLFCSRHSAYAGLFDDGVHCVMFDPDLSDFDDKLFHYLNHEDERAAIVGEAYGHVLENHTWDKRIEQFTAEVREVL